MSTSYERRGGGGGGGDCGRPARGAGGPDRMHPMCVSAARGVGARGASDRRVRVARAGEDPQALHGRSVAAPALRRRQAARAPGAAASSAFGGNSETARAQAAAPAGPRSRAGRGTS